MKAENRDIAKRYSISIILDWAVTFLLDLIPFIIMGTMGQAVLDYYLIPFITISLSYYFLGDKIFRNQSVGKKIMKIKIAQKGSLSLPSTKQILHRRWLEFLNHENRMLTKRRIDIDEKTNTLIVHQ